MALVYTLELSYRKILKNEYYWLRNSPERLQSHAQNQGAITFPTQWTSQADIISGMGRNMPSFPGWTKPRHMNQTTFKWLATMVNIVKHGDNGGCKAGIAQVRYLIAEVLF